LNNTPLKDRILWNDGDFTIPSSELLNFITKHGHVIGLCVDQLTPEIKSYNNLTDHKILVKDSSIEPEFKLDWLMPDEFKTLDIEEYIVDRLYEVIDGYDEDSDFAKSRIHRVSLELMMYKLYGMHDILRLVVYIVSTFKDKNVVWGVGRGSSVSSYILYLLGIHDVDSVEYDLDISDFLHD
jgi:DNA polymerase III alpha subunit